MSYEDTSSSGSKNEDTRRVLKTCLQCLQDISSNWRNTSTIWSAYMCSSNFFKDVSSPCLLTICGLIGLVLCRTYDLSIKYFLHVERSHFFLEAHLQLQPIQPGEYIRCLWAVNYVRVSPHHKWAGTRYGRSVAVCQNNHRCRAKPRHQINRRHAISDDRHRRN